MSRKALCKKIRLKKVLLYAIKIKIEEFLMQDNNLINIDNKYLLADLLDRDS